MTASRLGHAALSVDEFDLRGNRDDAALVAQGEELADGLAAVGTVVEGAVVDIHADEAVGQARVQVAGKLHGVVEGLLAVVEGVLDAVADGFGDDAHGVCAERAADGVAAQREHEAGGLAPPYAQVEDLVEAARGVSELALVDDETGVEVAGQDLGDDLVEGDGDGFDIGVEDFERQVGRGEGSGDGDLEFADLFGGQRLGGDDHGAVALSDAATAAHQGVRVLEVGVGVEADGGDVVEGLFAGAAVEGFDVAEGVVEAVAGDADLVGGQAVEHEGVVGVGTMGDGDIDECGLGNVGALGGHGRQRSFQGKKTAVSFRCG